MEEYLQSIFLLRNLNENLNSNIEIKGQEILDEIKKNNKSVVFISGHFANFVNGNAY